VDNRHWPYDSYDPSARRPPRDDDGWVVAGEEPNGTAPSGGGPGGWVPPARNGRSDPAQPQYGARTPPDRWGNQYPPAQPYESHPPEPGQGHHRYAQPAAPRQYQAAARPSRQPEPVDEPDGEPRPPIAPALTWAIGAFLVPMLLYLAWAFTRSATAPAGCVDASGAACPSPRVEAAENLVGVLPALTGAFILSLLIAIGIRLIATSWRSGSVGLAAAVVGAGIATVVAAAIS
jgi:hypothetical protein